MMKSRKLRDIAFMLHRYIGLAVGLLIAFVGLTGSLLVFKPEIEQLLISQRVGRIVPQEQMVSIDTVMETVKAAIADRPNFVFYSLRLPDTVSSPYQAQFDANNKLVRLFIHPYTGEVINWHEADSSFERVILYLHYNLLLGKNGQILVGITGLLMFILSLTGIILWPGCRKLIAGFKIKWNAHPKRVNFDIHKVTGIIAAIFLACTAFTGFCWNFADWTYPAIYAATFTPQPEEPTSKLLANQQSLKLSQILEKSNQVFPDATTFSVTIPKKPEEAIYIRKRQAHEYLFYGESGVYIDQYSGEVLRVVDSQKFSLADRVFSTFHHLHFGTFWGLGSRIFYIFVGLIPSILFVTGFVMYRFRKKKTKQQDMITKSPIA